MISCFFEFLFFFFFSNWLNSLFLFQDGETNAYSLWFWFYRRWPTDVQKIYLSKCYPLDEIASNGYERNGYQDWFWICGGVGSSHFPFCLAWTSLSLDFFPFFRGADKCPDCFIFVFCLFQSITKEIGEGVKKLWADQEIKTFFKEKHTLFQVWFFFFWFVRGVLSVVFKDTLLLISLLSDYGYCGLLFWSS